jgi:hypothetical protein
MAANVAALLDKAKLIHSLPSDYKLALVMGVSHSALINYRAQKTLPDALVIRLLCDLTGDDAALLLAEVEAERAKTDEARALWRQVVDRLQSTLHTAIFAVLAGVVGLAGFPSDAQAARAQKQELDALYIVEGSRAVFTRLFQRLARAVRGSIRAINFGGNHVQGAASTAAA